jgi:hypothetical protein
VAKKEIEELQGRRMVRRNAARDEYVGDYEKEAEVHRAALERIIEGGIATKVRILTSYDSCPVCKSIEGAYEFDDVPALPIDGCSHPLGCRCHYEPVLDRRGP